MSSIITDCFQHVGLLKVYDRSEIIDVCTAFVLENGLVCTALHSLIKGDVHDFRLETSIDPDIKFYYSSINNDTNGDVECKIKAGPSEIRINVCGEMISRRNDVAFLEPDRNIGQGISLAETEPKIADELFMIGYPIDIPCLDIEVQLNKKRVLPIEFNAAIGKIGRRLTSLRPIIKKCIISNVDTGYISDGIPVEETYILDGNFHRGSSGAPLLNNKGQIVGVVTKQIMTYIPVELKAGDQVYKQEICIPSGLSQGVGFIALNRELGIYCNRRGHNFPLRGFHYNLEASRNLLLGNFGSYFDGGSRDLL